jgi:hypothetical protein
LAFTFHLIILRANKKCLTGVGENGITLRMVKNIKALVILVLCLCGLNAFVSVAHASSEPPERSASGDNGRDGWVKDHN